MLRRVGFNLIDLMRGTSSIALLRELESIQFESSMAIQQRQKQLLDDYFSAIRAYLPLYAEYRSFEELPIIDKAFANRNREQLTNSHYSGRRVRKKTGGSTGEPLVFYTGTQSQSYLWAGIPLSWRAAGYRLGEPVAFLAGSSLFGTSFKESVYYKLMNIKLFSAFELSDERLQAYTKELIGEVTGRSKDLVSDPEGNTVHFMFFNYLFREDSRISSFRFYTIVINS